MGGALIAANAASAADPGPYVALGDSYTAAPLVSLPEADAIACLRSTNNYPSLMARTLPTARHRDVSCSGASTRDMTARQWLTNNPPQLDAVTGDARLVTLGIGFNDAQLGQLVNGCPLRGLLQPRREPAATTTRRAAATRSPRRSATPDRTSVGRCARSTRAPEARVVVVGYPSIVPNDGRTCWPIVPLSRDDLGYMDELLVKLNGILAEQAREHDAEYVDSYGPSVGHDVCAPPGESWWAGVIPTSLAYPWHPNAGGQRNLARSILAVLAGPRPAPVLSALRALRSPVKSGSKAHFAYSLNRAATVSFELRRELRGRREGRSCRAPGASNRRARPCTRLSRVVRAFGANGRLGANAIAVSAKRTTRPGRYRLAARASSGPREPMSDAQIVSYRVTPRR